MNAEQFAWREVIARIFEGFALQQDVAPPWLVNPETGRLLTLNYLYPEVSIAIRLEGLRSRQQRTEADERERIRQEQREDARERLCREHGIRLVRFHVLDEPADVFHTIQSAISWALRQVAKSDLDPDEKLRRMEQLRQARQRCEEIRPRIRSGRDLAVWADLWVDRTYRETRSSERPVPRGPVPRYALNMKVRHPDFGTGRVIALSDEDGDQIVSVRFDNGDERQFLARLVTDKLRPC